MTDVRTLATVSVGLGIASLLAVLLSHLALTDIWHGEGDLVAEWWILRVCFLVIVLFQGSALLTLRRVLHLA